ncbi:MAG: PEP-CTERM sorting domain-containing protein [Vicinamibacterales bacterium]
MSAPFRLFLPFTMFAIAIGLAAPASADAILMGPTPYLQAADSPFSGASFSYFYLETFEDGLLSTPGVTASGGIPIGMDIFIDSVDAEDGVLDGTGSPNGHSFYSNRTEFAFTFTFDGAILGSLPTYAGVVWTDIGFNSPTPYFGPVTFEAFGPLGTPLGLIGPFALGDGIDTGQTAEDRFFGAFNADGISAIRIGTNSDDWEVDDLQYGAAQPESVPEPSTLILMGVGSVGLSVSRALRRRRSPSRSATDYSSAR